MSWFTQAFRSALPFIQRIAENKNFQQAGEAAFRGIADKITESLGNPDQLKHLAATLQEKAPEMVGVIAAGTPAAKLVDPEVMPPGSVPDAK